MENKLDFKGLADSLLGQAKGLLSQWLPGGRVVGREYVCANIRGGHGDSLKVNISNGRWSDFAADSRGGDLISLYAAIYGLKQGEAAKALANENNFNLGSETGAGSPTPATPEIEITAPPPNAGLPAMTHTVYGTPTSTWCYRSETGRPLFYLARYDPVGERKQFLPWSWAVAKARFVQRGFNIPRPLYGLELLAEKPDAPILLVEGEKACDAARKFAGNTYNVMTWPNGGMSVDKADWTVLYGKKLLLWPDADDAGLRAMGNIAFKLQDHCPEIKIIKVDNKPKGWDAADSGFSWETFVDWAKPRANLYSGQDLITIEVPAPAPLPEPEIIKPKPLAEAPESEELPASIASVVQELGLAASRGGIPICNMDNALRVLEGWPDLKGSIWFDEFHCKFFTNRGGPVREWTDLDALNLLAFMQREIGMRSLTEHMVQTACIIFANRHARNEPKDWMDSLVWDGKPRLNSMFAEYFGAEDCAYTTAASKNWWISMVARAYRPGAKVDSMIILEGAQGKFKSTALSIIGGKWYAESHEAVTSKDFYMALQGKLIIEISELDAFSKAEVNTIKKVITCQSDRFRPPYGKVSADFPRRCVFVGTTNERAYLRDSTGARRFWPMAITNINTSKLQSDRDQLFAEAVARFKSGEEWYKMPKEALAVQESRRQHDEWEGRVADFLENRDETTVTEVALDCLGIIVSKLDSMVQRRIGKVMHQIGWDSKTARRDNATIRLWTKRVDLDTIEESNEQPEV